VEIKMTPTKSSKKMRNQFEIYGVLLIIYGVFGCFIVQIKQQHTQKTI
jgi:hypothetical protein